MPDDSEIGTHGPDPTLAVWRALDAEHTRNDDLRVAESVRTRESIAAVGELLAQALVAERRRTDDLRTADRDRMDEHVRERIADLRREIGLRAEHAKELAAAVASAAMAEKGRIDAIHTSLREAAVASNKEASDRATALAAQVVATAEAARVAVAQTTTQIDGKITTQTNSFSERFSAIERSINLGEGRNLGPDPAMAELIQEMKASRLGQARHEGNANVATPLMMALVSTLGGGLVAVLLALSGHLH